jgi:hypothetical protein
MDTGTKQYLCTVAPLPYLLSGLPPHPPAQTKCTVYTDSVCDGGGGMGDVELSCRQYSAGVLRTLCFWPDSEPTKLLHHPKQMTSKADIKGLMSLSSFVHGKIYILPRSAHLFSGSRIGRPIVGIYIKLYRYRSYKYECRNWD